MIIIEKTGGVKVHLPQGLFSRRTFKFAEIVRKSVKFDTLYEDWVLIGKLSYPDVKKIYNSTKRGIFKELKLTSWDYDENARFFAYDINTKKAFFNGFGYNKTKLDRINDIRAMIPGIDKPNDFIIRALS